MCCEAVSNGSAVICNIVAVVPRRRCLIDGASSTQNIVVVACVDVRGYYQVMYGASRAPYMHSQHMLAGYPGH